MEKKVTDVKDKISVFLCYTTFQVYLASYIANSESTNILVNSRCCLHTTTCWDYVVAPEINISLNQGSGMKNKIYRLRRAKKIFHIIEELIQANQHVVVYMPHLYEYLSNYFYFNYKHPSIEFNILQDGILNFYAKKIETSQYLRQYAQALFSHILMFPFIPFRGYLTGINRPDIKKQYLLGAIDLSDFPDKGQLVLVDKQLQQDIDTEAVMFIGQETLIERMDKLRFLFYMQNVMQFITKQFSGMKLYYKPKDYHLFQELGMHNMLPKEIIVLDDTVCVEELFLTNPVRHIISFNSTALLNIKLLFGHHVECYSYQFDKVLDDMSLITLENKKKLSALFTKSGIRLVC